MYVIDNNYKERQNSIPTMFTMLQILAGSVGLLFYLRRGTDIRVTACAISVVLPIIFVMALFPAVGIPIVMHAVGHASDNIPKATNAVVALTGFIYITIFSVIMSIPTFALYQHFSSTPMTRPQWL